MPRKSDYKQLNALGHGGFGSVFLILEKATQKKLVWKKITLVNEKVRRLAQEEANNMQKVQSDFLVAYLGCFEEEGEFYILTEYCDKGNLRSYINDLRDRGAVISEDKAWDLMGQLGEAVQSLHEMNIIHCDLKPENIFITGPFQIKLGDFGLAKVSMGITQYQTKIGGTPYYFAPELVKYREGERLRQQTVETDMFAVGAIFYEVIAQKHPFADNQGNIQNIKIMECHPDPLPGNFSEQLKHIVMQLLNKDPQRRLSTEDLLELPQIKERIQKWRKSPQMKTYQSSNKELNILQPSLNQFDINRKGLFIKNIASTVTDRMIELAFTPFNPIGFNLQQNSEIPNTQIANVQFIYEEDAQEALDLMNHKVIEGLNIEIEFQKRNERSPPISPPRIRPPQQLSLQPRIGDNKKGLFIKNINPQITSAEFGLIFIAFSPTKCVRPNGQPNTRPHFGFVDFETEEDASQAVVHINGVKVDGLALRLEYSNKPTLDRSKSTG
ncbi:MAG: putative CAMK family protein kinase [Streblomastix strix]|uniref:non-specific serine/threonine protein kinase n=1 Tax=Streblomastix strix TaxID=222440 RepID=A0A5J4UKV3_9EUKA|nr:MAG: putative CAMK family protein kinase [Streblomastix strix]